MLEQSPGARRPNTPAACATCFFEQAIDSCRAHLQKLLSNLIRQEKVAILFQHGDEFWQKRNESLGTKAIGGLPDHQERRFDIIRISPLLMTRLPFCRQMTLGGFI